MTHILDIVIRPLEMTDLPACALLHKGAFEHEAWDEKALQELLAIPGTSAAVAVATPATETSPIVGFLIGLHVAEEAEVLTIAVGDRQRGRGIGRALMNDFLARAMALGARSVFLEVASDNEVALKLYQDFGFAIVGGRRDYYVRSPKIRADAHVMRLTFF